MTVNKNIANSWYNLFYIILEFSQNDTTVVARLRTNNSTPERVPTMVYFRGEEKKLSESAEGDLKR